MSAFRYSASGIFIRFHASNPRYPSLTFLVRINKPPLTAIPTAGGILHSRLPSTLISNMHEPVSVSTPKTTRFCGMNARVASVITAPPINTVMPLFHAWLPRDQQNPDKNMKVQHIPCCQTYAPPDRYQLQSVWYM